LEACGGYSAAPALVKDLHPVVLDRLGLEQALASTAGQWQKSSNKRIQCFA